MSEPMTPSQKGRLEQAARQSTRANPPPRFIRRKPRYEIGARVLTVRGDSEFFRRGEIGTVVGFGSTDEYRIQFDRDGSRFYLGASEFKRVPPRRGLLFTRIALAWVHFWRGGRRG